MGLSASTVKRWGEDEPFKKKKLPRSHLMLCGGGDGPDWARYAMEEWDASYLLGKGNREKHL